MAKAKKDLSEVSEATLLEMFDYLCSKVEWGKAALDNAAILSMNQLFIQLRKDDKKYSLQ